MSVWMPTSVWGQKTAWGDISLLPPCGSRLQAPVMRLGGNWAVWSPCKVIYEGYELYCLGVWDDRNDNMVMFTTFWPKVSLVLLSFLVSLFNLLVWNRAVCLSVLGVISAAHGTDSRTWGFFLFPWPRSFPASLSSLISRERKVRLWRSFLSFHPCRHLVTILRLHHIPRFFVCLLFLWWVAFVCLFCFWGLLSVWGWGLNLGLFNNYGLYH